MNMEHWQNNGDGEKTEILGKKIPFQHNFFYHQAHKMTWG
jgi:hypothetical protein